MPHCGEVDSRRARGGAFEQARRPLEVRQLLLGPLRSMPLQRWAPGGRAGKRLNTPRSLSMRTGITWSVRSSTASLNGSTGAPDAGRRTFCRLIRGKRPPEGEGRAEEGWQCGREHGRLPRVRTDLCQRCHCAPAAKQAMAITYRAKYLNASCSLAALRKPSSNHSKMNILRLK